MYANSKKRTQTNSSIDSWKNQFLIQVNKITLKKKKIKKLIPIKIGLSPQELALLMNEF